MTLLNVSDLSHHYAHGGFSGKHQHQAVLNNVSLTLKSGETVALLGRSGCGKSTLARLLVGLESPSQGILAGAANRWQSSIAPSVKRSAAIFRWYFRTPSAP